MFFKHLYAESLRQQTVQHHFLITEVFPVFVICFLQVLPLFFHRKRKGVGIRL